MRLALLLLVCSAALADDRGELRVFVRAQDGFLAVDEVHSTLKASGFSRPDSEIRRVLFDDVNAAFRDLGRLCNQALKLEPGEPCPQTAKPVARLTTTDWATLRTEWTKWQTEDNDRPSIDSVFSDNSDPIIQLGRLLPARTGLTFDAGVDTVDSGAGTLLCNVMKPVGTWSAGAPESGKDRVFILNAKQGPGLLTETALLAALAPFTGGLWRRKTMEEAVAALYPKDRVLRTLNGADDEVFLVNADPELRTVKIQEGVRLFSIEMSPQISPAAALRAFYLILNQDEFLGLSDRSIKEYPEGKRPLIGPEVFALGPGLKELGLTLQPFTLVSGIDGVRVMTVVPNGETQSPAPKPDGNPIQPGTPLPGWMTLSGGFRYQPGQGIHFLSGTQARNLAGQPQNLTAKAGLANGGGLGGIQYKRDFVFFEQLRRRLSVNVDGSSELENKRLLRGLETNERRWSAIARGDLEWIPDRAGKFLSFFAEAERTNILLQRKDAADDRTKVASIAGGSQLSFRTTGLGLRRTLMINPRIRGALPLAASFSRFAAGNLSAAFVQELGHRIELHISGRAAETSAGTPLAERLSFGGSDMVRGFRKDEAIGLRAWSLQNEVWFPVPLPPSNPVFQWVADRIKVSPFFDAGGVHHATDGKAGARQGAGGGLRIAVGPGVYLKTDYGYGFGVTPGRPTGRFYVGAGFGF